MSYEEKVYLKTYLRFYLFFLVGLTVAAVIGVTFFNQEIVGFLWVFGVVSSGLLISFFIKKRSLKKEAARK